MLLGILIDFSRDVFFPYILQRSILQMSEYHFPSQRFKEKINLGFFSLNVAESGECQSILISPVKKLDTLLKYTLTGRGGDFDKFIH